MQRGPVPAEPMLIGVIEAARRVGISATTMYHLVNTGQVPHKRIGRAIKIPVKALEAWAESPEPVYTGDTR